MFTGNKLFYHAFFPILICCKCAAVYLSLTILLNSLWLLVWLHFYKAVCYMPVILCIPLSICWNVLPCTTYYKLHVLVQTNLMAFKALDFEVRREKHYLICMQNKPVILITSLEQWLSFRSHWDRSCLTSHGSYLRTDLVSFDAACVIFRFRDTGTKLYFSPFSQTQEWPQINLKMIA